MPVQKVISLDSDTSLVVWRMSESLDDLPVPSHVALDDVRSVQRRKEQLVAYAMLNALTGQDDLVIDHEPSGQPLVRGWHISLSHTIGWAALMLSRSSQVGVDIEYRSDRVAKVASRFIRLDERAESVGEQLVHWCAKEAVYKLLSAEDLQYFDMCVHSFPLFPSGTLLVDDLKQNRMGLEVHYEQNGDYVLAYSCVK